MAMTNNPTACDNHGPCVLVGLMWYGIVMKRRKAAGRHSIQGGGESPRAEGSQKEVDGWR
eukprot:3928035-Prymnesium_polylepis.1